MKFSIAIISFLFIASCTDRSSSDTVSKTVQEKPAIDQILLKELEKRQLPLCGQDSIIVQDAYYLSLIEKEFHLKILKGIQRATKIKICSDSRHPDICNVSIYEYGINEDVAAKKRAIDSILNLSPSCFKNTIVFDLLHYDPQYFLAKENVLVHFSEDTNSYSGTVFNIIREMEAWR